MTTSTSPEVVSSILLTNDTNFDSFRETDTNSTHNFDLSELTTEDASDNILSRSLYSFPNDIAVGIEPLSDEPTLTSDVVVSETDIEKSDSWEILDADIYDGLSLDFDLPLIQSLETNATNSRGLSEDLLENSSLYDNTTNSLGGLYDDPIEYGDPFTDAYYWRQQEQSMSCAVVAQVSIYQSLTGEYISEYDASNYAYQQGWYDPSTGTPLGSVGNILEVLGIGTYGGEDTSFSTLQYALAIGDKPIVGLDGNEIWDPQYDWYGNPLDQTNAGHAVWVTGIDYEYDGSVNIILNDSGHSNGMSSVVDYYDFMNAWQDYGYFATIADNPFT